MLYNIDSKKQESEGVLKTSMRFSKNKSDSNSGDLKEKSRKSLRGKLAALCALPVFVFGGCSGFYGHPAINATMGLLPEIAQPGGYKDYKNSERNEEENERRKRGNVIRTSEETRRLLLGD